MKFIVLLNKKLTWNTSNPKLVFTISNVANDFTNFLGKFSISSIPDRRGELNILMVDNGIFGKIEAFNVDDWILVKIISSGWWWIWLWRWEWDPWNWYFKSFCRSSCSWYCVSNWNVLSIWLVNSASPLPSQINLKKRRNMKIIVQSRLTSSTFQRSVTQDHYQR